MAPRTDRGHDTIAAIATPAGSAERGLVRVSGPRAAELVRATFRGAAAPDFARRSLALGRFDDGRGTLPLLLLWMPHPRSYTGEDVAEFHLPGHAGLLAQALAHVVRMGARPAEPGEFTRRAFLSGRIDLSRAEGVLALVEAGNAAEARAARALLYGGLAERSARARDALLEARALIEAALDFDEHDTGHVPAGELASALARARAALLEARGFEEARAGTSGLPRLVLCGAPNAGKSALFNALGGEALVSPHAGTTRDLVECTLVLGARRAVLVDTAGLEAGHGESARAAQAHARTARETADLLVWVVDASRATKATLEGERAALPDRPRVLVWHKTDLGPPPPPGDRDPLTRAVVPASSRTRAGLGSLRDALGEHLPAAPVSETGLRHARALDAALRELGEADALRFAGGPLELAAEALRRASLSLDEVGGGLTSEDVLDRIFARFCLGK